MKPFVSVIIPTYNRRETISGTIDSVLNQTFRDFEIIVVDDGSTDGTGEVLAGYSDAVRVIRRANGGAAAARNLGMRVARGAWIAFLDSDDTWKAEKLQVQTEAIRNTPELIVHVVNATLDRDEERGNDLFERTGLTRGVPAVVRRPLTMQLLYGPAWVQTSLIQHRALERIGGFDESIRLIYEDFDLFCRLATEGAWGFDPCQYVHIRRQSSGASGLSKRRRMDPVGAKRIMTGIHEALADRTDLTQEEREVVHRRLEEYRRGWGMALLRLGKRAEAREVFSLAYRRLHRRQDAIRYVATFLPTIFLEQVLKAKPAEAGTKVQYNGGVG